MSCLFENSYDFTCADKSDAIGGFKSKVWVGNIDDLTTKIDFSNTAVDVSALTFASSAGLHTMIVPRDSVSVNVSGAVTPSGLPFYTHTMTLKTILETSINRDSMEELALADKLFFIVQRNNGNFEIFGGQNGGRFTESTKDYGFTAGEVDTMNIMTIAAPNELHLPRIFLDTNEATTLALLQSYEV